MAQVTYFYGHALRTELHGERRDHEGRFQPSSFNRLDNRREVGKALRLEPSRRAGPGRKVRDRARQMSGDRQETDRQLLPRGFVVASLPGLEAKQAEDRDENHEPDDPFSG